MKTRLFNLWENIRTSFWFIPTIMVLLALGLSFLTVTLDRTLKLKSYPFWDFFYAGGGEGARSVLSTIAGSMITVAGVVFSITIVALTLASSQFGPRLLRNFRKDKGNQIVLGTFLAAFIYCLLVLRSVYKIEDEVFVPSLSVTLAIFIALANVGVFIYFIHHVAVAIQADSIIEAVYQELMKGLDRLFPEELGYEPSKKNKSRSSASSQAQPYPHRYIISATKSGYIQAIEDRRILHLAQKLNSIIELHCRPGEFIVERHLLATVHCEKMEELDFKKEIVNSFIIGAQRTPEQDAEFAIRQLTEIAIRALSPGINDPFTAITCLDRLGSAFCFLTQRKFPATQRYDETGQLRVIAKSLTFAGMTDAAFNQIRQYGCRSVAVLIRLLETLKMIADQTSNIQQKQCLLHHAQMVLRTGKASFIEENDKRDLQERYRIFLEVLHQKNT